MRAILLDSGSGSSSECKLRASQGWTFYAVVISNILKGSEQATSWEFPPDKWLLPKPFIIKAPLNILK